MELSTLDGENITDAGDEHWLHVLGEAAAQGETNQSGGR